MTKHDKSWTEKEIEILKKYYPKNTSMDSIMDMLPDRSYCSILHKASRLHLEKGDYVPLVRKTRTWAKDEINFVKSMYGLVDERRIVEVIPYRTVNSIKNLIKRVGANNNRTYRTRGATWSDEEIDLLKENYKDRTNDELMELFPERTFDAIRSRLLILGLRRSKDDLKKAKSCRMWTDEEIKILKENFDKPVKKLAELLPQRTQYAIRCMIKRMKQENKETKTLAKK